ncbi:uncharacterized protein M8220_016897 [Acridotheres tristis]
MKGSVKLTLAGCQAPIKAALSLPSKDGQERENRMEASWVEEFQFPNFGQMEEEQEAARKEMPPGAPGSLCFTWSFRQQFSGDRGRTPEAAGAVRELIYSTPAPGDFWGDINPCPTPRLTDDCETLTALRGVLQWNRPLPLENPVHYI